MSSVPSIEDSLRSWWRCILISRGSEIKRARSFSRLTQRQCTLEIVDASCPRGFSRSGADGDGQHDIADAVRILSGLFLGDELPCRDAADVNASGDLDLTDAVHLLNYLFLGGPALPAPFFLVTVRYPPERLEWAARRLRASSRWRGMTPEEFVTRIVRRRALRAARSRALPRARTGRGTTQGIGQGRGQGQGLHGVTYGAVVETSEKPGLR